VSGVTLDAGALIALDRGDRRVLVLLARARELGSTVTVPATALAQSIRRPRTQARLARLVRQPATALVALDGADAPPSASSWPPAERAILRTHTSSSAEGEVASRS